LLSCKPSGQEEPGTGAGAAKLRVYAGTASGHADSAIFQFSLDPGSGAMQLQAVYGGVMNPSFLTISPTGTQLYCVHTLDAKPSGGIAAFAMEGETGALSLLNSRSSGGNGPCYISTAGGGKWVLAANYSSGSVVVYATEKDGSLGEMSSLVQHQGSGPDSSRQEGPHAHFVRQGTGGWIYAADLGTDKVMLYQLGEKGELRPHDPPFLQLAPGSGPRHLDFHPNGRFVYVLNELSGTVTAFAYSDSGFQLIQTISSLPDGFEGYNKSADIHIHPSGKFLYASNRGDYDSIAAFEIDEASGRLRLIEHEREGIVWPRNFGIEPGGACLLVANKNDHSIISFLIDPDTGALQPTSHRLDVPTPMCIQFMPESL